MSEKPAVRVVSSEYYPCGCILADSCDAHHALTRPLDIEAGVRAVEQELIPMRDQHGGTYWIVDKRDIGRALRTWAREQQGGA